MNARTMAPGDAGQPIQASSGSADAPEPPEPAEPPEPISRGMSAAAAITLLNESDAPIDQRLLRDHLVAALPHLPRDVNRIDVAMLDDAAMSELHEQYHRISDTTDVLTFDVSPSPDAPLEVDVAVGVEVAKRQAEARGHTIERELLLYIVHGLLHCMGYDDHDTASFAAMHEKEDRVLDAIGVGRTFTGAVVGHRPSAVGEVSESREPTAESRQPPSHKDHWG